MNSQGNSAGQRNTNDVANNENEVDLAVTVNPSTNIVAPEETMNVLPLFPLTPENPSEANLSLSMNSATNAAAPEHGVNIVQLPFKRSSSYHASGEFVEGGTSNTAEHPAQTRRRRTESRASVLNAYNDTTSSLFSPSMIPPPPQPSLVQQELNLFHETTESNLFVLNANNNTNPLSSLSSLLSPPSPPPFRVVREEPNLFRQTTPTEANQGRSHVRQHNAGPPRRSVNMIRASSYPNRSNLYQGHAPQHNLQPRGRNRTSAFTIGSPSIPRRNMSPNSNSNAGANAIMTPLQGQGGTIIRQTPSSDFHRRLFNDPAGPSTNAQPIRMPAHEVQFLHGRSSGRYSQMLNLDNVAEELMDSLRGELLFQLFEGEPIFEAEEQNANELPQGLTEETIMQHLRSFTFLSVDDDTPENEREKCPICLDEFENGNRIGRLHSCEHKYHVLCIKNWLLQRNFCPVCKRVGLETKNNENDNGNA